MNVAERGIAVYLGEKRLRFLQGVTVGVAGCGGLGSNCAMHLVRSGFRRFVLVDMDRVDPSNLNRQAFSMGQVSLRKIDALAENLVAVNPDCELRLHDAEAAPETMGRLFAGCDVVVEAFDRPEAKAALVSTLVPEGRLVVAASGIGGVGGADGIVTRRIRDNFYLVGDGETECGGATPPMSPRVGVAAAKQADVVLDHFLTQYANQEGVM